MKRLTLFFAVFLSTNIAFCQEPTTVQKENLKGNVFSVRWFNYAYSENFGSPTEGKLRWIKDLAFDAQGRVVLFNFDYHLTDYYLVKYKKDGDSTIAGLSMLYSGMDDTKYKTLNDFLNEKKVNDNHYREITYNSDNIVTKYDVFKRFSPTSKFKLDHRKIAKPLGNGVFECKLYDESGKSFLNFKETYNSNGQLTELDNEREFNRVYSYDKDIMIQHAGKYEYNNKGQLVLYTQQKNYAPNKNEYIYNDHGDLIQDNTLVFHQSKKEHVKNRGLIYDDYKYDANGNWIYRRVSDGKNYLYIEKRQIEYCNTSEEIESKVKELYSKFSIVDIDTANEFGEFYNKYLTKEYVAVIPLVNYDPKYSSVKNADKASVFIGVRFNDPYCRGYLNRMLVSLKMNDKIRSIANEINIDKSEKMNYTYSNGKIIMNNDVYEIDPSGTLKNVTKNIVFKEGNVTEEINRFLGR